MTHPHTDSTDAERDPSFNPRLRGELPPIDDSETDIEPPAKIDTVFETERKTSLLEKMWQIRDAYGFVPLSSKEVSIVYSIGKRQGRGTPLGAAARSYLQSIHRHQMTSTIEDTSSAVRAVTHTFEEYAESALRQLHFTAEFEDAIHQEGAFSDAQTTVGVALQQGERIKDMTGALRGKGYVEGYIAQVNSMIPPDAEDVEKMPEDVMKLTLEQIQRVFNKMRVENVARVDFWKVTCEGASQHPMAHVGLKETVNLRNQQK